MGFILLNFSYFEKKKTKKKGKPMISRLLYHPAQVSWSDGLVPLVRFLPCPGEPG